MRDRAGWLAQLVDVRHYARGAALHAQGHPGSTEDLFFVVRGNCRAETRVEAAVSK